MEFYKANKRGCTSISATQSVNKREKDLGVYKEVPGQSDIKKTDENKSKHETQKQRRLVVTAKCFAVDTCEDDATGVLAVLLSVTQSISIVHRQMPSGGEKRGRGQILAVEWQVALSLSVKAGLPTPAVQNKPLASGPFICFNLNKQA